MTETAVLICGHGSRDPEAIAEFELVAAALRPRLPDFDFAAGYLEFARPTIRDGLAALSARGARQILAIPGMLFAASHVKNDLPREMNSFMADNLGIDVRLGRDLGIDQKLLRAAADRIAATWRSRNRPRPKPCLSSSGAAPTTPTPIPTSPSSRPHAVGRNGASVGPRSLSSVSPPRVDAALMRAARLGLRRIIVFPYFLFTGVLVKRVYAQTDAVRPSPSRDRVC